MKEKLRRHRYTMLCLLLILLPQVASQALHSAAVEVGSNISFAPYGEHIAPFIGYASAAAAQLSLCSGVCAAVFAVSRRFRLGVLRGVFFPLLLTAVAEAGGIVCSVAVNAYTASQIKASLLACATELLYILAVFIAAAVLAAALPGRRSSVKAPLRAPVWLALLVSMLLQLADLVLFRIVPHFIEYDDVTSSEVASMVFDALYCAAMYFIIPALLSIPAMKLFTGRDNDKNEISANSGGINEKH